MTRLQKVNEFEYGADEKSTNSADIVSHILNDEEANVHYRYSSAEDLLENLGDLKAMIEHHMNKQVPRLKILNDYFIGRNTYIYGVARRLNKDKADHRISHGFARYISQFIQGYLVGNPVKVSHEDEKITEAIKEINLVNDADAQNSDLVLDQSKYGRAYELIMRTEEDEDRFYLSDVFETFVIYSDEIDMRPIAAVRYTTNWDETNKKITPTLYAPTKNYKFKPAKADNFTLKLDGDGEAHNFNGVQIIEYQNNRFRMGDYENVISLIDAYDSAQSDTANYMTDLNDALLAIIGRVEMPENINRMLKEANAALLTPEKSIDGKTENVSIDYKYKQYDVAGTEAYKRRVTEDIHKFSNTPNMNDENFASNTSGVAMKYKLFGLEQARASKEAMFSKGLRQRYGLIANVKGALSEFDKDTDLSKLSITFTPNFPEATETELQAFTAAGGKLSLETLLETLSFVESAQAEMERIKNEENSEQDYTDEQKAKFDEMRISLLAKNEEEKQGGDLDGN